MSTGETQSQSLLRSDKGADHEEEGQDANLNGDVKVAELLGISQKDLTPHMRATMTTLLQEMERLRKDVCNATQRLEELEKIADLDPLMPIANRRAFVRDLSRTISYAQRYNIEASLLYFDVNDLKQINDEYGHAMGDAVLVKVAEILTNNVRESDVVARLGGDEFAVLLVQASEEQAVEKGTQLSRLVSECPVTFDGKTLYPRTAFGVYTFKQGESPSEVLNQADKRMYAHKRELKRQKA